MTSADDPTSSGALACLGGVAASAEIRADFDALAALPGGARREIYRVVGPCLVEPVPASAEGEMRAFAVEHAVDVEVVARAVRACRFLLREAALRDVPLPGFADDLERLGADGDARALLLQGYERAKRLVRAAVVEAAVADHGKVVERVAWRVEHVTASNEAYDLHVPVAVLTLSYREGDKRDRVTLQLTAESVRALRELCDRFC